MSRRRVTVADAAMPGLAALRKYCTVPDTSTPTEVLKTCPRCWGRGYKPEARRPSRRNPHALGFYARTCPRCGGSGGVMVKDNGERRTA